MIKSKSVLILGAGASCPFGYPSGNQLREKIIKKLGQTAFKEKIIDELNLPPQVSENFLREFAEGLKNEQPSSIDQYLATLGPQPRLIGKATIVSIIIDCELIESLFTADENWYAELYKILRRDTGTLSFGTNNISIITFNYDRSLEQFLYSRLKGDFGPQNNDIIKKHMEKIPIFHVYGSLPLSWENLHQVPEYGMYKDAFNVSLIAEGLKLMGEDTSMIITTQSLLAEAENVYFLGFGYHQSNLDKLNLSKIKKCNNIVGTCYKENIHNQRSIKEYFDNKIKLSGIDCDIYQFILKHFDPDENYGVEAKPYKYR